MSRAGQELPPWSIAVEPGFMVEVDVALLDTRIGRAVQRDVRGTARLAERWNEGSPALVCAGVREPAHRPALPVVVLVEVRSGVPATDRRGAAHEVEVVPPRCVEAAR
jgi:hypothetical protein